MPLAISQCELVGRILKLLGERFKVKLINVRQMNAVIAAADLIVDALAKDDTASTPGWGMRSWMDSDDVGLSSKFMAYILAHGPGAVNYAPQDPDDFIRCEKFLDDVPKARENINSMKDYGSYWSSLIDNWDKIKSLIAEEIGTGRCPKAYDFMKTLQKESWH